MADNDYNDDGIVNYDQHYHDYDQHYYVRTDDNLVVHNDGSAYYVNEHDDNIATFFDNYRRRHNVHHDYCSKYDDYGTIDLYDNHGCRITITTSCPTCGVHHIRPATSTPEHFDAPQFDHIDKHDKHHDDHYVHNDDDYLHDTAPDHDYSDTDEHDDPADYEHLVTGYEDSFHHDRRISTVTYPVVSISRAEAKRLFDLIRGGAGGPHNEHHHIARGGDQHNDDSPTSAT